MAAVKKNEKIAISETYRPIFNSDEIYFADASWPSRHYRAKHLKFNNERWQKALIFQNQRGAIYLQTIGQFCRNLAS